MLKICQNIFQPILEKSYQINFHVELQGGGETQHGQKMKESLKLHENGLKMILANFTVLS